MLDIKVKPIDFIGPYQCKGQFAVSEYHYHGCDSPLYYLGADLTNPDREIGFLVLINRDGDRSYWFVDMDNDIYQLYNTYADLDFDPISIDGILLRLIMHNENKGRDLMPWEVPWVLDAIKRWVNAGRE